MNVDNGPRGVCVEIRDDNTSTRLYFDRMSYGAAMIIAGCDWSRVHDWSPDDDATPFVPASALGPTFEPFAGCTPSRVTHAPHAL